MSITYQEAIAYSHNYATAKPDIGATEREHILGLCQVLEAVGKERGRFSRLFANACESLGAVREALGNEDAPETTGLEPHFVRKLKDERDALAAHASEILSALNSTTDEFECCVRVGKVIKAGPEASIARRDERLADAIERASEDRAVTEDCPRYRAGMEIAASMVRHWRKEGV
ncbi:hypothetical protein NPJ88_007010 [Halomonas elongata]|uniref:hypothetical protein n=1 Tax=Halomonas elongata TaxID=2746 RepID=UPI00255AF17E|nr:hypothetical protein [Halomonas elongata]MDL4862076.1 hypothetical protein [Halomonas elongata]